jgi:hypothetical protein
MATEAKETVTINGQVYDALTGMPIPSSTTSVKTPAKAAVKAPVKKAPAKVAAPIVKKAPAKVAKPVVKAAAAPAKPAAKPAVRRAPASIAPDGFHAAGPQRSQTLNRRVARKTTTKVAPRPVQAGRSMDIARSGRVAHFGPRPDDIQPKDASELHSFDRPATVHPLAERLAERPTAVRHPLPAVIPGEAVVTNPVAQPEQAFPTSAPGVQPATSQELKNAAITQALSADAPATMIQPTKKRSHRVRNLVIVLASIVVLAGAAYVTFMNLPVLSVSLASAQAGIKASYPSYLPDGYHLKQPITFNDGQVVLEFDSNSNSGSYTVTQARSSWDSSAVLTNIVQKAVGDDYITTQDSGLTIYTYKGNAAWVNAGILYTIKNDGTLSNTQVDNIATSL